MHSTGQGRERKVTREGQGGGRTCEDGGGVSWPFCQELKGRNGEAVVLVGGLEVEDGGVVDQPHPHLACLVAAH
jgi:hypothetical protein